MPPRRLALWPGLFGDYRLLFNGRCKLASHRATWFSLELFSARESMALTSVSRQVILLPL